MNFYQSTGKMALGSRLRRLSDILTEDAAKTYDLYKVALEPRWFPVFYTLQEHGQLSVSEIAQAIQQSHASVSQVVKEMKKKGLVRELKDKTDGRKTLISLSKKGESLIDELNIQTKDVQEAAENLLAQMQHNLWEAIEEMEYLLGQQGMFERIREKKKQRESCRVQIVDFDYSPEHQQKFRDLNAEWIEKYFWLEEKDLQSLNDPQKYILDKGGHILLAEYNNEVVGACALLKMDEQTYELAKMAVSPAVQGKNIGYLLGKASMDKARYLGATSLYLESNTKLEPAINLYHKLGFKKITGKPTPYERCNIQMELRLS